MKMTKKITLIMLSLALVFSLAACGNNADAPAENTETAKAPAEGGTITPESIKEKGEIVMISDANYAPFIFHKEIDGEDQIIGFDVAISQYIADDLGVDLVIQDTEFHTALQTVASGMADMSIGGISADEKRKESMDFTEEYIVSKDIVLVKKGDEGKYSDPELMKENNAVIGVQTGTVQEKIAMSLDGIEVVSIGEMPDMIVQLQGGHIDAIIMVETVADLYAANNEDLVTDKSGGGFDVPGNSGEQKPGSAIAVPKGNPEFVEYLNGLIQEMKDSGFLDEAYAEAVEQATI